MKKILFISHDASRTGAPILLLNLMKWLKDNKSEAYDLTLLLVEGGVLKKDFSKLVKIIDFNKKYEYPIKKLNNVLNRLNKKKSLRQILNTNYDLIFSNTIVNGKVLEKLHKNSSPIITYVHELDYSIDLFLKRGSVQGTLKLTDFFLCGSKLVQENLVARHNIKEMSTKVIHSFIDYNYNVKNIEVSDKLRNELNIPNDALVVGMAGSFIWRKGPDLFVDTAVNLSTENIFFLWIGANNQNEINKVNYDLTKSNSKTKIIFIPPTPDYSKYFNLIDVFFLSSREDPYPLVMIDATSYGIPVICFKNAGGTQEFIDDRTGFVVPFADVNSAADKISYYNNNRNVLIKNEAYIKEKSSIFHKVENNARLVVATIDKVIK